MDRNEEQDATTTRQVKEPVLVVPRKLTQSAYATLVQHACVSRSWHLEGRYGSRTFALGDRMGLPLLPGPARLLQKFQQDGAKEHVDNSNRNGAPLLAQELEELLATDGVDIVDVVVPLPRFVEKLQEIADATVHPDRKPSELLPVKRRKTTVNDTEPAFTFVDLFCGIGGFAIALEVLGGQCLLASDIDESCREMYLQNVKLSQDRFHGDIYEVPNECFPQNFDLLVGGFPCQPFSTLGEQPGLKDGPRGLLYTQIVRVLKVSRPKAFLLENVPGLVHMKGTLETIVTALEQAGYDVSLEVCSARGLTAQSRKRLFFVGLRKEEDIAREPFKFPYIPDLGFRAIDIIDFGEAAALDENNKDSSGLDFFRVTESQMEQLLHRSKRWKSAKLAWPNVVCDTLDGHYGVTVGKGNSQLVPCPAPLYPRCLTPRECARLMGFPSHFCVPSEPKEGQGKRAHVKKQWLMFGNAVCPPVIAFLAGEILAQSIGTDRGQEWRLLGLQTGISLALDAVIPSRQETVSRKLQSMGLTSIDL